jgi:transcriptional regulator with AbiEi antitoxin domain of type IV toxin-antitoxin system
MLHVGPFEVDGGALRVSAPELALLEMLSEVDFHQPSQEARELTESGYNLRVKALQEMLRHCTGVKTVRLRL